MTIVFLSSHIMRFVRLPLPSISDTISPIEKLFEVASKPLELTFTPQLTTLLHERQLILLFSFPALPPPPPPATLPSESRLLLLLLPTKNNSLPLFFRRKFTLGNRKCSNSLPDSSFQRRNTPSPPLLLPGRQSLSPHSTRHFLRRGRTIRERKEKSRGLILPTHPDSSTLSPEGPTCSLLRVSSPPGTKLTGSISLCLRVVSPWRVSTSVWRMSPSSLWALVSRCALPNSWCLLQSIRSDSSPL